MPNHENKTCGRCNKTFECKAGNIAQCQCGVIELSLEERAYIESKYDDCLCVDCLTAIKTELTHFKEKFIFNKQR